MAEKTKAELNSMIEELEFKNKGLAYENLQYRLANKKLEGNTSVSVEGVSVRSTTDLSVGISKLQAELKQRQEEEALLKPIVTMGMLRKTLIAQGFSPKEAFELIQSMIVAELSKSSTTGGWTR